MRLLHGALQYAHGSAACAAGTRTLVSPPLRLQSCCLECLHAHPRSFSLLRLRSLERQLAGSGTGMASGLLWLQLRLSPLWSVLLVPWQSAAAAASATCVNVVAAAACAACAALSAALASSAIIRSRCGSSSFIIPNRSSTES